MMNHSTGVRRGSSLPVLAAVCILVLSACNSAAIVPTALPAAPPPAREYWPTDGWRTDAPAKRGLDEAVLAGLRAYIEQQLPFLDSLLIVKDGYLVYEVYFNGYDAARRHQLASVTKSFTSALYGVAQAEGVIPNLDATLGGELRQHFAGLLQRDQRNISLRHLLQMRSGLAFDEAALYADSTSQLITEGFDAALAAFTRRDLTRYALAHPMAFRPGEAWSYSTVDSQLLSAAFQALTGRSLEAYASQRLFSALGITDWNWPADANGVSLGGVGLELTPRDMAKFGFLYLNHGVWDGQELLRPDWVQRSTAPQGSGIHGEDGRTLPIEWYGMQWWTWKPALFSEQRAIAAQGYGGQHVILLPDLDIIVVTTANPAVAPDVAESQGNQIYDLVKYDVLSTVDRTSTADPFWIVPDAPPPPAHALYTVDANGRGRRAVLADPLVGFWGPAWSPDGTQIAFHSNRDGNYEIYVMNADGSDVRRLTNNMVDDGQPSWSPDSSQIAFISARDGNLEIYVMDSSGEDVRRLTNDDAGDLYPSWSPDGSRIAFSTARDGGWEIYVMNADVGSVRRLTNNWADDWFPSWSPDSEQICFASSVDGNWEIYAVKADGSNLRRLTFTLNISDTMPAWSRQ